MPAPGRPEGLRSPAPLPAPPCGPGKPPPPRAHRRLCGRKRWLSLSRPRTGAPRRGGRFSGTRKPPRRSSLRAPFGGLGTARPLAPRLRLPGSRAAAAPPTPRPARSLPAPRRRRRGGRARPRGTRRCSGSCPPRGSGNRSTGCGEGAVARARPRHAAAGAPSERVERRRPGPQKVPAAAWERGPRRLPAPPLGAAQAAHPRTPRGARTRPSPRPPPRSGRPLRPRLGPSRPHAGAPGPSPPPAARGPGGGGATLGRGVASGPDARTRSRP